MFQRVTISREVGLAEECAPSDVICAAGLWCDTSIAIPVCRAASPPVVTLVSVRGNANFGFDLDVTIEDPDGERPWVEYALEGDRVSVASPFFTSGWNAGSALPSGLTAGTATAQSPGPGLLSGPSPGLMAEVDAIHVWARDTSGLRSEVTRLPPTLPSGASCVASPDAMQCAAGMTCRDTGGGAFRCAP